MVKLHHIYKSSDDLKRDSLSQTLGPNKTASKSFKKKVHVDLFSQNMSSIFTNIILQNYGYKHLLHHTNINYRIIVINGQKTSQETCMRNPKDK